MERRAPAGDNVIPGGDDTDIMGGDAIDIRLIHTYTRAYALIFTDTL